MSKVHDVVNRLLNYMDKHNKHAFVLTSSYNNCMFAGHAPAEYNIDPDFWSEQTSEWYDAKQLLEEHGYGIGFSVGELTKTSYTFIYY